MKSHEDEITHSGPLAPSELETSMDAEQHKQAQWGPPPGVGPGGAGTGPFEQIDWAPKTAEDIEAEQKRAAAAAAAAKEEEDAEDGGEAKPQAGTEGEEPPGLNAEDNGEEGGGGGGATAAGAHADARTSAPGPAPPGAAAPAVEQQQQQQQQQQPDDGWEIEEVAEEEFTAADVDRIATVTPVVTMPGNT